MTNSEPRTATAAQLTQAERDAMDDLYDSAQRAFKSKPMLKTLSRLQERGLITFDPFVGQARLTNAGRAAIAKATGGTVTEQADAQKAAGA